MADYRCVVVVISLSVRFGLQIAGVRVWLTLPSRWQTTPGILERPGQVCDAINTSRSRTRHGYRTQRHFVTPGDSGDLPRPERHVPPPSRHQPTAEQSILYRPLDARVLIRTAEGSSLTHWHPLLPYGHSYKASCDRPELKSSFVIFDVRALWRSGLSVRASECPDVENCTYVTGKTNICVR